MSVHIAAKQGEIADKVILPGDPLRAKVIAELYLEDAICYSTVRGMLGYTGTYQGERISVQGVGMGMPSMSIYAHELMADYGIKQAVRVGTTGAIQEDIAVRDIIMAQGACTDSNMNHRRFAQQSFAPIADFELMQKAHAKAQEASLPLRVGNVLTTDTFYHLSDEDWKVFARFGVLCAEMEVAALYTTAAQFGVQALALLTVSDHIITEERLSADERQNNFMQMVELALATLLG
jgi:purine-nucleoside phosphorylase